MSRRHGYWFILLSAEDVKGYLQLLLFILYCSNVTWLWDCTTSSLFYLVHYQGRLLTKHSQGLLAHPLLNPPFTFFTQKVRCPICQPYFIIGVIPPEIRTQTQGLKFIDSKSSQWLKII